MVGERVQFLGSPRQGAEFRDQSPRGEGRSARGRGGRGAPPPSEPESPADEAQSPPPPAAEGDDNIPF